MAKHIHIHIHRPTTRTRDAAKSDPDREALVAALMEAIRAREGKTQDADFKEEDHPRDHGKFTSAGGSGPSGPKPTSATAKGSKAAVHELLSSGHRFSVDELMKATGCSNKSTLMTALADLKNPKYAGKLGALKIEKHADGGYHVVKNTDKQELPIHPDLLAVTRPGAPVPGSGKKPTKAEEEDMAMRAGEPRPGAAPGRPEDSSESSPPPSKPSSKGDPKPTAPHSDFLYKEGATSIHKNPLKVFGGNKAGTNTNEQYDASSRNMHALFNKIGSLRTLSKRNEDVPLAGLKTTQPWVEHEKVQEIAKNFDRSKVGGKRPVIVYEFPDGTRVLRDGNHRAAAAHSLGHTTVPAVVRKLGTATALRNEKARKQEVHAQNRVTPSPRMLAKREASGSSSTEEPSTPKQATSKAVHDPVEGTHHVVTLPSGAVHKIQRLNSGESLGLPGWHAISDPPNGKKGWEGHTTSYMGDTKQEAIRALQDRETSHK